jgi:hypothetical protein
VAASGPSPNRSKASESQIKFARNPLPRTRFPANSIASACRFQIPNQRLGNSSRTTNLTVFELYRVVFDPEKQFVYTLLSTNWAVWLFFMNFLFLVWRLFNRMAFTGMIYNVRHALMAALRLVVGNFVNFFATWRAVRVYLSHRISGTPLVWDKTSHSYPIHMGDLTLPHASAAVTSDAAGVARNT